MSDDVLRFIVLAMFVFVALVLFWLGVLSLDISRIREDLEEYIRTSKHSERG